MKPTPEDLAFVEATRSPAKREAMQQDLLLHRRIFGLTTSVGMASAFVSFVMRDWQWVGILLGQGACSLAMAYQKDAQIKFLLATAEPPAEKPTGTP